MTATGFVFVDAFVSSRNQNHDITPLNELAWSIVLKNVEGETEVLDSQSNTISAEQSLTAVLALFRTSVETHLKDVGEVFFLPATPMQFAHHFPIIKAASELSGDANLHEFWGKPIDVVKVYQNAARLHNATIQEGKEKESYKECLRLPETCAARCESLAKQVLPRVLSVYEFETNVNEVYPVRMSEVERATATEPERFVRLRGLVWASTEDDVSMWLGRVPSLTILDVTILRDGYGKSKGEAWVELAESHEADVAVKELHHQYMRNRYVEVFRCTGADLSTRMGHANARAEVPAAKEPSGRIVTLKISRLPQDTTIEQIRTFMEKIPTTEQGVTLMKLPGFDLVDAFIEIPQEYERRSLMLHHQTLNDAKVEICAVNKEEIPVYMSAMQEPGVRPTPAHLDVSEYVVKVRGLPHSCDEYDVAEFFRGLNIRPSGISMEMERGPGGVLRSKGAYVQFLYAADVRVALMRHKHHMQARYIEVFETPSSELEERLYGPIEHESDAETENRECSSRDSTPPPQASSPVPPASPTPAPVLSASPSQTQDGKMEKDASASEEDATDSANEVLPHANSFEMDGWNNAPYYGHPQGYYSSYPQPYPNHAGGYYGPCGGYGGPGSEMMIPPPRGEYGVPCGCADCHAHAGGQAYYPQMGYPQYYNGGYYGGGHSYYQPNAAYESWDANQAEFSNTQSGCFPEMMPQKSEGRPRGRRGGRGRSRRAAGATGGAAVAKTSPPSTPAAA